MKKIIFISIIILLFPFSVFGALLTTRVPSGFTITNPVSFEISFDDYEADCGCDALTQNGWGVAIFDTAEESNEYRSNIVSSSTTSNTFVFSNLPAGQYQEVMTYCTTDGVYTSQGMTFEWDSGNPIFEVLSTPTSGNIITFPSNFLASTTANIGSFAEGLNLFIVMLIGIPLAFWVLDSLITLTKPKK